MTNPTPKRVASVAVFDKKGRLMFGKRRDNQKWTMPGGHLDEGETPGEGAIRELLEEANLQPEGGLDFLGEMEVEGDEGPVHVFAFKCEVEDRPSIKNDPDEEVNRWKWFDIDDGVPEEILSNLHSPKNVTLKLLGLQDWEEEKLEKGLSGILAAGMLATAPMGGAAHHAQSATTTSVHNEPWSPEGLHNELHPIAHLESSFGQNTKHGSHSKGDYHTAIGAVGFKPVTAHEEYKRSKVLQGHYPDLHDQDKFMDKIKGDHKFYNLLASTHWTRLKKLFRTPEKAAFAWRWGQGRAARADDTVVHADPYVQKFKSLMNPEQVAMKSEAPLRKSDEVDRMLEHPDINERRMALKLPGVTREHIVRVFPQFIQSRRTWSDIVAHPLFDDTAIAELLNHKDPFVRAAVAPHAQDPLLHDQILNDVDFEPREALAKNPHLKSDSIEKLVKEPKLADRERSLLALHPNAPMSAKYHLLNEWMADANKDDTAWSDHDTRGAYVLHALRHFPIPNAIRHETLDEPYHTKSMKSALMLNSHTPKEDIDNFIEKGQQRHRHEVWSDVVFQYLNDVDPRSMTKDQADKILHHGNLEAATALLRRHGSNVDADGIRKGIDKLKAEGNRVSSLGVGNFLGWALKHPEMNSDHLHELVAKGNLNRSHMRSVIQHPKLGASTIQMLLDQPDPEQTRTLTLAENAPLQPIHVSQLLRHSNPEVRNAVMRNRTPGAFLPEHMDTFIDSMKDEPLRILDGIAGRQLNDGHISKLLGMDSGYVIKAVLESQKLNPSHIDAVLGYGDPLARSKLLEQMRDGGYQKLRDDQLARAVTDPHFHVRVSAIQHPQATSAHISQAMNDVHPDVRRHAARRMGAEHIGQALFNPDPNIRHEIAQRPDLTPEHLRVLLKDQEFSVRATAVQHPNTSIHDIRDVYRNDPHPSVKRYAQNILGQHEPDTVHSERVAVRMRTARMRRIRDELAQKGKPEVSPKEMSPADVAFLRDSGAGRLPNGNYSAKRLQEHIDSLPPMGFNVSHTNYGDDFDEEWDPSKYEYQGPTDKEIEYAHDRFSDYYEDHHDYEEEYRDELEDPELPEDRRDEIMTAIDQRQMEARDAALDEHMQEFHREHESQWRRATGDVDVDTAREEWENRRREHHEGQQRHSNEISKVFQLNVTNEHVKKMKELGVYSTFRNMMEASKYSAHPVTDNTIGWVRYTGDKDKGYFIDEVQSDFGQSFVKQASAQAKQNGHDHEHAAREAQKKYPDEHFNHISQVLFGGKHPNEVLHEAFHQHLRDHGFHGAEVHVHAVPTKAKLSGLNTKEDVPGHFKVTYQQVPERMEMKPAKYGELKHQDNPELSGKPTYKGTLRKFEEIAAEWLRKSNLEIDDSDTETAHDMLGFNPYIHSAFEAARFMASGPILSIDAMRRALWNQDGNLEKAALEAYGFDITDEALNTLRSVMQMTELGKSEDAMWTPKAIEPTVPGSEEAAEGVKGAFATKSVQPVKLGGKHSKGSLLAKDTENDVVYLLKPGSGGQSPAAGANQDPASQSAREACFYEVAETLGLGQYVPKAAMIQMDDKQVAAIHLLPFSYKSLEKKRNTDPVFVLQTMNTYLRLGILHRWAVMDFILGNPDRHGQNLMISKEGRLMLIDHGSAFAGSQFDPAYDKNSFIPFYLRAWVPKDVNFNQLSTKQKLDYMPKLSAEAKDALKNWISHIDEKHLEAILTKYGINPESALYRLGLVKMSAEAKDLAILKLWVGT